MTCGELEILLCDYVDGVLDASQARSVESHLVSCTGCSEMAADARAAMAFMERAAEVEAPAQLTARILSETGSGRHGRLTQSRGVLAWLKNLFAPALEPRLVMGMALTVLSFSMMARCAGVSPRQLRPADMDPLKIWASIDDRAHRAWGRSVKFYEDIKFVYEIQSRLSEWMEQQEEENRNKAASVPVEDRRVPATAVDPAKGAER